MHRTPSANTQYASVLLHVLLAGKWPYYVFYVLYLYCVLIRIMYCPSWQIQSTDGSNTCNTVCIWENFKYNEIQSKIQGPAIHTSRSSHVPGDPNGISTETSFWTTMPSSRHEVHATQRTPREPGRGGSFSAAARKRIQHAAALAETMGNIHSFKAFGVVFPFTGATRECERSSGPAVRLVSGRAESKYKEYSLYLIQFQIQ